MKKVTVQIVDDLSGSVISEGDGRSISFSFDDESFEIDLSNEHIEQFRDLLAPYITASRQVGKKRRTALAKSPELQIIRDWARSNGIQVSDRGRIAASVREAYAASL